MGASFNLHSASPFVTNNSSPVSGLRKLRKWYRPTTTHISKAGNGHLTSQKLDNTVGAALAPSTLTSPPEDGAVHFGDSLMLSAAQGGVLAVDGQNRCELNQEAYVTTRTRPEGTLACMRTTWVVAPAKGLEAPEDGLLRVGMRFSLKAEVGGQTCYLQSQRCAAPPRRPSAPTPLRP